MATTKRMDHTEYPKSLKSKDLDSLLFIIRDCCQVLEAWPDHPNGRFYMYEMQYCRTEIENRKKRK
jgi:hypothetical protein